MQEGVHYANRSAQTDTRQERLTCSGFAEAIQEMDSVVSCYYVTGSMDLLLKVACNSPEELDQIHRKIMELPGIKDTRTHVVLKNVKNVYSAIRKPTDPQKK